MFSSVFWSRGDDKSQQQSDAQIVPTQQQQDGSERQLSQDDRFQEETTGQEVLRSVWDTSISIATSSSASSSASGQSSDSSSKGDTNKSKTKRGEKANEGQNKRLKGKEMFSNVKTGDTKLQTIAEALNYCRNLVHAQLECARIKNAPMNEPISEDALARQTIVTLLPDQFVRILFIEVARQTHAWKRIRPLFGSPPYHFLKPEDGGLFRAGGFAAGRINISYSKVKETAAYSQFGFGHLVDDYSRQYKVVIPTNPQNNDQLPYNIEVVEPQKHIFMNVRVPKRSKEDRMNLMKNSETRGAVLFPRVGEVINVKYSEAVQKVVGQTNETFGFHLLVKSLVPRAVSASTASMVAVKITNAGSTP